MKKFILIACIYIQFYECFAQEFSKNSLKLEIAASAFTDSKKHFQYNTSQGMYYEARVGYRFNKYFEASVNVGYQLRHYIYFAKWEGPTIYGLTGLGMDRYYVPASLNAKIYVSDFVRNDLKILQKAKKMDVYVQLGICKIFNKDVRDPAEKEAVANGAFAPYYWFPYTEINTAPP